MNRFRMEGFMLALTVMVLVGLAGVFGNTWLHKIANAATEYSTYRVLAALGTAVLVGVAFGLQRRFPGFVGAPPVSFLFRYSKSAISTGLVAMLFVIAIRILVNYDYGMSDFWMYVLTGATVINTAIISWCTLLIYHYTISYRLGCEWERSIHPQH